MMHGKHSWTLQLQLHLCLIVHFIYFIYVHLYFNFTKETNFGIWDILGYIYNNIYI